MPTEKGTSPLHKNDIIFDETPPGQHPTKTNPILISFGNPSKVPTVYANSGITVY